MRTTMWTPDPAVTDHTGKPLRAEDDFFVVPPPEIGAVISAATSLKQSCEPTPASPRRIRVTVITGLCVLVFVWLLSLCNWKADELPVLWRYGAAAAIVLMAFAWLAEKPSYTCSYVGTNGIARFACYGSRDRITRSEVFRFDTATNLRMSARNIYVNGCYFNTPFSYRWFDHLGHRCYRLAGTYRNNYVLKDDPYLFARAAEKSWSHYLLPTAMAALESGGVWRMGIGVGRYIEIGKDYVELSGRRMPFEELDLRVERGFLYFGRLDRKPAWYKLDRRPRVAYASLQNALLTILLIEELTGADISAVQPASDARYHMLHYSG